MRTDTVFEFDDYRSYLLQRLGQPGQRTGLRRKACEALRCHTTYLSQVLRQKSHLSLEHAESLNRFLHHTDEESEFFLILVCCSRAGTTRLKERFLKRMEGLLARRNRIKSRIANASELTPENCERFYSHWLYTAIHALVSVKEFQDPKNLARTLSFPFEKVSEALNFLQAIGIIVEKGHHLEPGPTVLNLAGNSSCIPKHHTNWRLHAIQSLFYPRSNDLHYSAAVSMSLADAQRVRENILRCLQENVDLIKTSPPEDVFVYNFDFYRLT